ncbi:hypothetical protein HMPREF9057_02103, partial [Actinomyces sp. oral taxon 171 str. F0337]
LHRRRARPRRLVRLRIRASPRRRCPVGRRLPVRTVPRRRATLPRLAPPPRRVLLRLLHLAGRRSPRSPLGGRWPALVSGLVCLWASPWSP